MEARIVCNNRAVDKRQVYVLSVVVQDQHQRLVTYFLPLASLT
jgi:hypothetical protein